MTSRELICKILQIKARCDKDLKESGRSLENISPRDCYNQIKAFHYDAIVSVITEWQQSEDD